MDVNKTIETRRSIRKYQDKEISMDLIKDILNAARLAPSAYNAQPSRFIVIQDKKIKETLKENNVFKQPFVYNAPVIIICLGDPEVYPKERLEPIYSNPKEIAGDIGAVRDVAISAQNLVLRATELGLGTCYIGLVNRDRIKEILGIPDNYVLPFVITVGYPDEDPDPMPRKDMKDIII
ncbi:MAG: nitroreductase family protein [Candidatus Paceibacterota bacterium]|jgi:nitroreductase